MSDLEAFLEHHGVRGMKWGHHKTRAEYKQAVKAARKEVYSKSIDGYKAHKLRNTGATVAAGILMAKYGGAGKVAGGVNGSLSVAAIPMLRAQGYSKGKSVAIGLLGGPIGFTIASEVTARKMAKA